ncbi:phage portal protein [Novipirellula caenicola]|uniref:Phage portal protein, lambda family n=1 Tax=Novipirellula caenicola TaxID=1536901 RepID=A0ABP9VY45_9BACT
MLQRLRTMLGLAAASTVTGETESPTHFRKSWTASRFDSSIVDDPERSGQVWYSADYAARGEFESADTNRLNSAHWSAARDTPINDDLADRLPTMRTRSNHEAWNNTAIEGLILQHSIAVAGDNGPLLDLQAEDEIGDTWCELAEKVWEDWCEYSDAAGQLSLAARMKNFWNRGCWTNGEWFDQFVYPSDVDTPIKLRLHAVEPQRIQTPMTEAGNPAITLGIKRDALRRPKEYWVANDWYGFNGGKWYTADGFMHGYEQLEVGQARGVPWAQSGLPTAADLRDYDDQVMDAARAAADMAIVLQTKHPDAPYVESKASVPFRRRRMTHVAPGWEAAQLQPHQPTAQYKDHRHERMGDLGRGKGVPSMVTRLDAREHNYSSARFDRGLLHESAKHVRTTLYNPKLKVLVVRVLSEAILVGVLPPPPCRFGVEQIWPAMPQVDEDKSSRAENRYLGNGTLSYSAACAERHGRRANDVIRIRQRDANRLAAAGLPSVAESVGTAQKSESSETPKTDES